jgi:uncharacterized protein YjiS (DUF1127 family)
MSLISYLVTRVERSRMRKDLLRLDDRLLFDIGYSRELLEDGVRSFPWRIPAEPEKRFAWTYSTVFAAREAVTEAELEEAVEALAAYNDAELRDLELTRDSIDSAVRHGRPGYPEAQPKAA